MIQEVRIMRCETIRCINILLETENDQCDQLGQVLHLRQRDDDAWKILINQALARTKPQYFSSTNSTEISEYLRFKCILGLLPKYGIA